MNYVDAVDVPEARTGAIKIHGPEAFEGMRAAGKLAAGTLDYITPHVKAGITTEELDRLCHEFILDNNAIPAPLNYRGFPKSICTSINHVICHGIPGPKKLKEGDSLNIDVTVILDGWFGDTSRMFFVGKPKLLPQRLCQVTFEALWKGIEAVKPGARLGDIGHAIQTHVEAHRYSVVRDFCGHGIGRVFHDEPSVMHFGKPGTGPELRPGMFFTIEPMVNAGKPGSKILADGWTAVTRDKTLSMQFEHTLAVTDDGYEVFTKSPKGWFCPPYDGVD
ncbi:MULTISPECIES: type I methionyl aminopeptidase [Kordiimonas]|jgi:methionyl aminopeptidase|uniref:type I methionyl aminopeptidase n=1 Tax=Kordiimonas TaxID=288021 RepID=UPI0025807014|nr:type I methionyl aminopeptidase [Kordiimonas sp. UBA4487]